MFNLVLICGGPSLERGISLNSVRSFYDNLGKSENINIKIIFVDLYLNKYFVNETFLYSNTTSDFDFKLSYEGEKLSEERFIQEIKNADLVMPIIHGSYGEDGKIQEILENAGAKFVASGSNSCKFMYNKKNAEECILRKHNLKTIPKLFLDKKEKNIEEKVLKFFEENNIENAVIKPIEGGSSFGVTVSFGKKDCLEKLKKSFETYNELMIEKFCVGREFTVVILQNKNGEPVALIPTEIEIKKSKNSSLIEGYNKVSCNLFTTRRKYLPTNETHYYNPPRFSDETINEIRRKAQELFKIADAKDFLRIDGWLLDNGEIYFSDFNPISGMEQNSFLFQQGAKVGLSHKEILKYILKNASYRQNVKSFDNTSKKRVNILLGGITSERQVSLMSGSNVWLKLLNSEKFDPYPYLLTFKDGEYQVLPLNYDIILNHTVEEILYQHENRKTKKDLVKKIREELGIDEVNEFIKLNSFIKKSKLQDAYVFLGLHGGFGEGGELQKMLEKEGVSFNGCRHDAAKLCMDKYETGKVVNSLKLSGLRSAKKIFVSAQDFYDIKKKGNYESYWQSIVKEFNSDKVIIKPRKDGCSTGVIILTDFNEFKQYIDLFVNKVEVSAENAFKMHSQCITIGINNTEFLIEEYIQVDKIEIVNNTIVYKKPVNWIELTIGVLETKGKYHALNPSITIANSGVLSLEEKFQGGTGVNITPPPEDIISLEVVEKLKNYMEILCKKIGIRDYCRIDVFVNSNTKEIIVIEANTLPALTCSTVIFQQAGKENPPATPLKFIENIISNSL